MARTAGDAASDAFSRGAMSFAYGLTAEEAGPYLKLPGRKKLASSGKELRLVDP